MCPPAIKVGTPQWEATPFRPGKSEGRSCVSPIRLGALEGPCQPRSGGMGGVQGRAVIRSSIL